MSIFVFPKKLNKKKMICFPNAKINLGLNIVAKRPDGYHNLETIFYPIQIKDALEIIVKEDQEGDSFHLIGLQIDAPSADNLVMKALQLMRESYDFPSVEVHLLKNIPFGAGIGGGSADASSMLRLLNDTFSLGASRTGLANLAVQLGADCPFFVYNQAVYARGIGEIIEPIELDLSKYKMVLVKPDVFVSTKDAFSKIIPKKPEMNLLEVIKQPIESWKSLMVNDFEKSVFTLHPEVKAVKDKLYNLGALYASMSGSGASVFALFEQKPEDLVKEFPNAYVWMEE